jgi:hypothetical protein
MVLRGKEHSQAGQASLTIVREGQPIREARSTDGGDMNRQASENAKTVLGEYHPTAGIDQAMLRRDDRSGMPPPTQAGFYLFATVWFAAEATACLLAALFA